MAKQWDVVSRRFVDVPDNQSGGTSVSQQAPQYQPQGLAQSFGGVPKEVPDAYASKYDAGGLVSSLNPNGYAGIINKGYEMLGQPAQATPDRAETTNRFVTNLASTFVDLVHKKTGQLPTEDQLKDFIAQNANSTNASKFVTGELGPDQMNVLGGQYLQFNPDIGKAAPTTQQAPAVQTLQDLNTRLPGLYDAMRSDLGNYTDTAFIAPRRQAIEDEAALGRLRSPASIPNIANVDIAKANALQGGLMNIGTQQLSGETDLSKALAGVQQNQQQINNQASQFGQNLGFQRLVNSQNQDINTQNIALQNRQLGLAGQLGQMQANAGKNNGLGGALGGATSGAAAGSMIMPGWGTAIGAGIGGLAGYFGSRS